MKENSKTVVVFQTILLLIFLVVCFVISDVVILTIVSLLLITMIFILGWQHVSKQNNLMNQVKRLELEKVELLQTQVFLQEKNQEYELLFNSLDGAVFSIDKLQNLAIFSKGAEHILGYSVEILNNHPTIYMEMIHSEDVAKVKNHELQLLSGNSSKVEFRIILSEGDEKWLVKTATPIRNQEGIIYKINGQILDITNHIKIKQELKQLAYSDDLTDLPNRKALDRHIEKALARSKRHEHNFTLMFIDLDDFKKVNDTMGHDAGDLLLKEVVNRLHDCIREEDLISRIGGDEFIIVFEETNKDIIEEIAGRILETVALPYLIHEQEAKISLSIGVSMFPDDGIDKETLIDHADKAMYFAKNNGKNNYKIYTPDLNEMDLKKGLLEKWVDAIQNSKIFSRS